LHAAGRAPRRIGAVTWREVRIDVVGRAEFAHRRSAGGRTDRRTLERLGKGRGTEPGPEQGAG
jgi:hypothetical protein